MRSVLFLAVYMEQGWGVSLEIGEICRRLRRDGTGAFVGAQRTDASFDWLGVAIVEPAPDAVRALARQVGAEVIVAQTSPYFQVLPALTDEFETWAWENGDPTPRFFPESAEERAIISRDKRAIVYPHVHRVVAISDFIKHDIEWPAAHVVRLGADHMPARPPKTLDDIGHSETGAIRVGTLMRLGPGEARYKGNHLFLDLIEQLRRLGVPVEPHVAGRGQPEDAAAFEARGIVAHLNLSEAAKADYLRSLDVFVSMSQWEGFNLPLAEAQALGTLGLALDVGAHPELCPFLMNHPDDGRRYITRAAADRAWLRDASALCGRYIRQHYSWESTANEVKALLRRRP